MDRITHFGTRTIYGADYDDVSLINWLKCVETNNRILFNGILLEYDQFKIYERTQDINQVVLNWSMEIINKVERLRYTGNNNKPRIGLKYLIHVNHQEQDVSVAIGACDMVSLLQQMKTTIEYSKTGHYAINTRGHELRIEINHAYITFMEIQNFAKRLFPDLVLQ